MNVFGQKMHTRDRQTYGCDGGRLRALALFHSPVLFLDRNGKDEGGLRMDCQGGSNYLEAMDDFELLPTRRRRSRACGWELLGGMLALLIVLTLRVGATDFPTPFNTEPDTNAAPPSPAESLKMLKLPPGFSASI